nr:hypothetical protein [Tanacetum cinerariifolium]
YQTEQGDSTGGKPNANIQPVAKAADIAVENMAHVQSRRQGKRKSMLVDAGEASHPPKKLRKDHGTPSRTSVGGKSRYVLQWSVTNGSHLDDGRVCREMVDEFAPLKFFASVSGMEHDHLFTEFNVRAARQMSLSDEVRMRAEYNVKERKDD